MKIRFLLGFVVLAISFALPTFAQQKDTVDPQIIEQLVAIGKTYAEAVNNNDAAAVAALYTDDAVYVVDTGPIYGREAIQKHWADAFQKMHFSNLFNKRDKYFLTL
jgi:ketosteroid isomerase-like protein